jgi:uncharacterized surface protein with fasciclin (FAS1) repeats
MYLKVCALLAVLGLSTAQDPGTIVSVAQNAGSFTTLVAALEQASLVETLNGAGPFTVFAPVDDAFDQLMTELDITAQQLLAREDLSAILTYHVLGSEVMSSALSNGQTAETLQGSDVTVTIDGSTVMVNDATVTTADVDASNGVIHIINKVLMPPAQEPEPEPESPGTIVAVAQNAGTFTTLVSALEQANLVDTLNGDGPFTVFAPVDDAFTQLLADLDITATQLLAREDLSAILTYHVLGSEVMSSALSNGQTAETLQGSDVTVTIDGSTVMVSDATVTTPDVDASNGVIHIIDKVLMPPANDPEPEPEPPPEADGSAALNAFMTLACVSLAHTLL